MARVYADIPKFKRAEAAMREVQKRIDAADRELLTVQSSKRTARELEGLKGLQDDLQQVRGQMSEIQHKLYEIAEGK